MDTSLRIIFKNLMRNPLRFFLTAMTFSLGVCSVILVYNLNHEIRKKVDIAVSDFESVWVIAGGSIKGDKEVKYSEPRFDQSMADSIKKDIPEIRSIGLLTLFPRYSEIQVGHEIYRPRNVATSNEDYLSTYGLKMVRGSYFSKDDFRSRNAVMIISREAAELIFGSDKQAIGSTIQIVNRTGSLNKDRQFVETIEKKSFTVVGVIESLSHFQSQVLGLGDFIVPYTLYLNQSNQAHQYLIKVRASTNMSERLTEKMRSLYGEKAEISVWSGSPNGPKSMDYIRSLKRMSFGMILFFGFLGFIVLIVSTFGIFGVMLISTLERTREIGLKKAIGCTRFQIVRFFMLESLFYAFLGCAIGIVLASIFNNSFLNALRPFLSTQAISSNEYVFSYFLDVRAVLFGVLTTVMVSSVFSIFPAVIASRVSPIECLREM